MLNKLRGFLRNELGLSMVQGMVLAGIVAGGALVTTKLMVEQKQAMKSAETRDQIEDVHNLITGFLKDKDNCRQTMVENSLHITLGDSVNSHDITKISGKDSGNIIATVGGTYLTNNVLIQSMTLKSPTEGTRDLEILYERLDDSSNKRTKRGMGAKHIRKSIPLRIQKSAAGDFEYCYVVSDSTEDKANDTNSLNKSGEDLSKQMCEEMVSGATDPAFYWDESRSLCVPNTKCPGDKIYAGIDEQGNRICKNIKDWVNFGEILSNETAECPPDSLVGFQIDGANKQVKVNCTITNDTTPPSIISFSPAAGKRISPPTQVLVTFSELMKPETVTNTANWSMTCTNGGSYSVSSVILSGLVATVNLSGSMPTSGTCTFIASSAITDKFNNGLVGGLQVIYDIDKTPPTIASRTPSSNSTNVAINTFVTVTFTEALNPATITNSTFTISGRSASVSYNASTNTATLIPSSNLSYSTTYTVTVSGSITDVAGNAFVASSWSFTTEQEPDTTAPVISSFSPVASVRAVSDMPMQITANFSEAMKASTVTAAANWSVACTGGGTFTVSSVTLSGQVAYINLSGSKTTAGSCTLTASTAIQDLAGNALGGTRTVTYTFGVEIALYGSTRYYTDGSFAKSCKDYLVPPSLGVYNYSGSTGNGTYRIDPDELGAIAPFDVYCDMTTNGGGWILVWKFYRETAKISGNNTKNWGNHSNIANNGSENCNITDLNRCNANFKGELFSNLNISEALAFNMGTNEYRSAATTFNMYSLAYAIHWDERTTYYGNVFYWKGVNHRYTLGSGDYYYSSTIPGNFSGGGTADLNHWRATFLRSSSGAPVISYVGATGTTVAANASMNVNPTTLTNNGGAITNCTSTPALPTGITINATTCKITGISTTAVATATYTITATNSAGSGTATVQLTVTPPPPTISYASSMGTTGTFGLAMSVTPSTLSANGGTISGCSISPALPSPLTINNSTCVISGTPSALLSQTNYTVTATNTGGSSVASVTLRVNAGAPTVSYTGSSGTSSMVNSLMSVIPLVSTNGADVTTCTVSPSLPSGLSIGATSCIISGIPTLVTPTTTYTVTVTNIAGSNTGTVSLTVTPPSPTISYAGATGTNGSKNSPMSVSPTTLNANGGTITSCYTTPGLPAGLTISSTTCVISGTPLNSSSSRTYTVSVISNGGTSTADVTLSVSSEPTLSYPAGTNRGVIGTLMTLTPTLSENGSSITSCTVSPALPGGLSINNTTCVISGTPNGTVKATDYTVTATNSSGFITASVNIAVTINCPSNYIAVSKNPALGVTQDFCVAKYEMRSVAGLASSQATNSPWVNVTASAAQTACTNLGATYDLISNPEWMTVAREVEAVGSNWSTGTSGSGTLARGWSGSTTYGDTWNNTAAASSTGSSCLYNSAANTCSSTGTHTYRRTLTLSTGDEIWDFSGNIMEWVDWNQTISGFQLGPTSCTGTYVELSAVSCSALSSDQFRPKLSGLSSTNGIGRFIGGAGGVTRRGGQFNLGSASGAFSIFLNATGTDASTEIGFRCVQRPVLPPTISYVNAAGSVNVAMSVAPQPLHTNGAAISNCTISPSLPGGLSINSSTCVISGTPSAVLASTEYTVTATNSAGSSTAKVTLSVLSCPTNFVAVAKNPSVGTDDDFCVMKYEARNDGSGNAVSQASGSPYVSLTIGQSQTKCTSLGGRYDLISNPEWMTIARNAESIGSNWSSGVSGGGVMARGFSASTSFGDTWTNSAVATSTGSSCLYNTGANTCASSGSHLYKRTLSLSNGEEIWDFSGNVWEWVDWNQTTSGLQLGPTTCSASWVDFPAVRSSACFTNGALLEKEIFPLTPGGSSVEGFGSLYGGSGGAAMRGGVWSGGSQTGPYSMFLGYSTANAFTPIGFRCVYRPYVKIAPVFSYSGATGTTGKTGESMTVSPTSFDNGGETLSSCTTSPALPSGLSINNTTCVISGTPSAQLTATTYTVTATNTKGSGTATVSLTVNIPPTISYAASTGTSVNAGSAMSVTPSTLNNNGSAITSCTISPALPAPLQINNTTCVISGTPSSLLSSTTYTVTATNEGGSSTATVTLSVTGQPPTISYSGATGTTGAIGDPMTVTPTTLTNGGLTITTCTSSPALPTGLSVSAPSCVITGTPTGTLAATSYTITATNLVSSATATVSLTVNARTPFINLNAGNSSSYPGTGTNWTSLVNSWVASLVNGPTYTSVAGGGISFDGVNDYANISPTLNYRPYGLEYWIKTNCNILANDLQGCNTSGYSYQSLGGWGSPGGINLGGWTSLATNEVIHIHDSSGRVTYTNQTLNVGLYHLFVNWNGSNYDIWLNGVKQTAIAGTSGHATLDASMNNNIWIGTVKNDATANSYNFWGNIHEFRLWNSQVPDSEVTAQFNSTSTRFKPTLSYPAITSTVGSLIETTPTLDNKGSPITNCTISPALPSPLTISTSNCMISGTPTSTLAATTYTVTATSGIGTGSTTVTITVNPGTPVVTFSGPYTGTVGTALTITPTINNRGAAVTSCTISPALPSPLVINATTCEITGTPSAILSSTSYSVTATNTAGTNTPVATFSLSISAGRPVVTYLASYSGSVGTALTITPTVTTNGSSVFECSTSPALPASLTMNQTTCAITGTPTAVLSNTSYTVTAKNGAGINTLSSTFSLSIAAGVPVISFASSSGMNGFLNTLMSVTPSTLDNKGSTITACTSTPSLPSYLTMTAPNCVITGTPTSTLASTAYSITATNSAGTSTATSVTLSVIAKPVLSYSASYTGIVGTALNITPSITTNGSAVTSCSISPQPPSPLTFNSPACTITGTPSTTLAATTYSVTATNGAGTSTAVTFTLTNINKPVLSYLASYTGIVGTALNITPTITTNGSAVTSCSISPQPPSPLTFNSPACTITGTPSTTLAATTYSVTATNGAGTSTAVTFSLTNIDKPVLSYLANYTGIVGSALNITPSITTNGSAVTSCSISPLPPSPLTFNSPACTITGTPSTTLAATTYSVTATNGAGTSTAVTFTLTNIAKPTLSYSSATGTQNSPMSVSPASINNNGSAITSCAPVTALPAGLSVSSPGCVISGTPSVTITATAYTIRATNSAGSTDASVTLTINPGIKNISQFSGYRGWSDNTFAVSCSEYRNPTAALYQYSGSTGDGIYRIDVDGSGALTPFDVKCDMTSDGGGWTVLIAHDGTYQTTTSILSNYATYASVSSGIQYNATYGVFWNSSTWGKNANNTLTFSKIVPANQVRITFTGVYGNNGLGGLDLFNNSGTTVFSFSDSMRESTYGQYLWINGVQELFPKNAIDGIGSLTDLYNETRTFSITSPLKEVSNYYYPGWGNNQRYIRELKVRNSTTATIVNNGTYRSWSDGTFARTCSEYLSPSAGYQYSGATGDGVYRIDPDGSGAIAAADVTCEMSAGGWTVIKPTNPNGFNSTSYDTNTSTSIHCNGYIGCVGGYGGGYWGPGVRHTYSGSGINVVFSMTSAFATAVYNLSNNRQVKWWIFGGDGHTGCTLNFAGTSYAGADRYVTTNAFSSASSYSFSASTSCSGNPYFYYVTSELRYVTLPTCSTNTVPGSSCSEGGFYLGTSGGFKYMTTAAANEYPGGGHWPNAVSHCDNLVTHGYSDWYMPSWDEYKTLMEPNYSSIQLSASWYWSSTQCSEYGWDGAWTTTPGWSYNESYCVGGDCCLNKVYNPSARTRCVRKW